MSWSTVKLSCAQQRIMLLLSDKPKHLSARTIASDSERRLLNFCVTFCFAKIMSTALWLIRGVAIVNAYYRVAKKY